MTRPVVAVAAAVLLQPDGRFLLAQRPQGKPYPGYWEFPGGKIEPGETAAAALARELKEELDIEVRSATPWITRIHTYTHATVRLHFFRVTDWAGEPRGLEGQAHVWQSIDALQVAPMLPANTPIFRALALPPHCLVSAADTMGMDAWLAAAQAFCMQRPALVQLREKSFGRQRMRMLVERALARLRPLGAVVIVNSDCGAHALADGTHLTSRALRAACERPAGAWVGASCHDAGELAHAAALGLDYALLGPVQHTPTHPDQASLGWPRFAELAAGAPMPIYALGGLRGEDLGAAMAAGAHGVAMRSRAFG